MADNWSLSVIMIFFISLKLQDKVESQNVQKISPDPTYVTLGDTLVLNVTYDFTGQVKVEWKNDGGKTLYLRLGVAGVVINPDTRASLEGQATLILKNTALYDNGTYTVQVTPSSITPQSKTFVVIIQVQPTAKLNVSSPTTVPGNSDVYYSCEGKNGVPTSTVSWYKGNKFVMKGEILLFGNITRDQAGNYTCKVQSGILTDEIELKIIVQFQPTATLNVSTRTTVPENSDVYYMCEGKKGFPTSTVSWYKGNKLVVKGKILSFRNIKREEAGSYTCKVRSGTLTDEIELKIIVQFKPSSTTLKSVPEIAIITESVKITCKADGLPEPKYVIYYNGAKLTDKGEIAINPVKCSHDGEYRCNATNKFGMDSVSYLLNVTEKSLKSDCTGCALYIILVTSVCGIIVGMIFHFGIMSLRRRFKSIRVSQPSHKYDTPETHPEGAARGPGYQELDLRNREPDNRYQSLRMNTGETIDNETEIEDEAGYQIVG